MRIVCHLVGDFLECLEQVEHLFQDTIRVNIIERPEDGNGRNASKYSIIFQASCVVYVDETSEYLLEVGQDCGRDIRDSDPDSSGSDYAKALKLRIKDYAMNRSWKVLPGSIHI